MKRKWIGIMVALVGSGGILLSGIGEKGDIEGWEPLNLQVAQALGESEKTTVVKQEAQAPASEVSKNKGLSSDTHSKPSEMTTKENSANSSISDHKTGTSVPKDTASDVANIHKINVNTADVKGLMELPGIGEKKAQAIVDYRNLKGPFRKISDLNEVKGIGTKMMEKIAPNVEL
ncbi:ComEA family DNA-binding protein [Paenibacillus glacialis]|uniref:Helix-hairpin-helix DNA-binding motif class 1 domain-containing protein n=1 Tax=Paenibacillus glacialis TaxID=494026 RepID=A0A168D9M6_9BACL|nr:helix-hairpin-helix domain-containing protein [Paenibacillus glacialis]OAB34001.1 hypothetical protein PGLA_24170 [Paenibacillus glacialis]